MPRPRDVLPWCALGLALLGHWLLFAAYVRREIAWGYATNWDQTASLFLAYRAYEWARQGGVLDAVVRTLRDSPATGVLLHLAPLPLFALGGPSRLAALAVNWLAFAGLQVVFVAVARRIGRGWALPALALGLLWAARAPFYWIGGLDDFRSDFVAGCLYGTFVAAVLWSDVFRRRGPAIAAGAVAGVCVMERAVTSVYLAVLLLCFGAVAVARLWRSRDPDARSDRRRVVGGLFACAAACALLALPVLAVQASRIWGYYVVGHVTSLEKEVRLATTGAQTAADALLFYPRSLWIDHLGALFVRLALCTLAALLLAGRLRPAESARPSPGGDRFAFVGLAVLVPLAVLTLDTAKSPVVAAIVVPALVWLIVLAAAALSPRTPPVVVGAVAAGVLVAGAAYQFTRLTGRGPRLMPVAVMQDSLRLQLAVADVSRARGWTRPTIMADRQRDYLYAIRVSAYERRGQLLDVQPAFASSVLAQPDDAVARAIEESDFLVVTRPTPNERFVLPFDRSLFAWYPRLLEHCARERVEVGTFQVPELVTLYVRPPATR